MTIDMQFKAFDANHLKIFMCPKNPWKLAFLINIGSKTGLEVSKALVFSVPGLKDYRVGPGIPAKFLRQDVLVKNGVKDIQRRYFNAIVNCFADIFWDNQFYVELQVTQFRNGKLNLCLPFKVNQFYVKLQVSQWKTEHIPSPDAFLSTYYLNI